MVRQETLDAHPQLEDILSQLSGIISEAEMQEMNYAVTDKLRDHAEVAREFLVREGLLEKQ
jgi:glycine betaine/choline ABC-type transport system substrate-binding protein